MEQPANRTAVSVRAKRVEQWADTMSEGLEVAMTPPREREVND